ncbi:uncharacterized protein LOC119557012 [Drosophila subpulchrella]|uniref:uncharacterized protein LOC119557012 n=1 Tax=Drosophila subpulchrella TaxID=1486046 RepID=UPI0018A152CC|nr:uncharacterized protein LOC119557012 [Drosophila subpulchrella]
MEETKLIKSSNEEESVQSGRDEENGPVEMDVSIAQMIESILQNRTLLERPYLPRSPGRVLLPLLARPQASNFIFPKMTLAPRQRCVLPPRGGQQMSSLEICKKVHNKIGQFAAGREFTAAVLHVNIPDKTVFVREWDSFLIDFLFVGQTPLRELGQLPNFGEVFVFYSAEDKTFSRVALYAGANNRYVAYRIDYGDYIHLSGMERIFALPDDLQKLPAQAIRCSVPNVIHAAHLSLFKGSDGVRLRVLDNNGVELMVDRIKEGNSESQKAENVKVDAAFEQTVPGSRELGITARIKVTSIWSTVEFYGLFLDGPVPPVWQEEDVPKGNFEFHPMDMVLAKYQDGLYYRAMITLMSHGACYLFFVDFGCTQYAVLNSLAPCFAEQKVIRNLAVKFKIEGLRIAEFPRLKDADGVDFCREKLLGQEIAVTLTNYQHPDRFLIRIQGGLADVQQQLLEKGYAFPE